MLDLGCCQGGIAVGYDRAGFDVTGIDHKRQPRFPFQMFVLDFLSLTLEYCRRFDAIHASVPCQGYIQRNKNRVTKWPRLIEPMRARLIEVGKPYVLENVEGSPLIDPVLMCGTMFGLPLRRHRLFESPWLRDATPPPCNHWGTVAHGDFAAVYGMGGKGPRHGTDREPAPRAGAPSWEEAMGIDWMDRYGLTQAVPPAYGEYIGTQLLAALESGHAGKTTGERR